MDSFVDKRQSKSRSRCNSGKIYIESPLGIEKLCLELENAEFLPQGSQGSTDSESEEFNDKRNRSIFCRCKFLRIIYGSQIFQIANLLFIFSLLCAIFYMFTLVTYYKSLDKNKPTLNFCSSNSNSKAELNEWEEKGREITKEVFEKINSESWRFFKSNPEGTAYDTKEGGKWKLNGTIFDASPDMYFKIFYDEFEKYPEWEPFVLNATVIKTLGPTTRLCYHKERYMGFTRDFVGIMHANKLPNNGGYTFGLKSVNWPEEENKDPDTVRGIGNACGGIAIPGPVANSTSFEMIFDLDLKLDWVPSSIFNSVMIRYAEKKIENLKNKILSSSL